MDVFADDKTVSLDEAITNIKFNSNTGQIFTNSANLNTKNKSLIKFYGFFKKDFLDKNAFEMSYIQELKNKIHYLEQREGIMRDICNFRKEEGWYINKSLEEVRYFISWFISNVVNQGNLIKFPPFINKCGIFQCNPYFQDCFGSNPESKNVPQPSSSIIEQIRNKITEDEPDEEKKTKLFNKVTICVFNVVNISQLSANNPPPIPYIDVTNLQQELQKIKNIDFFYNEESDILIDDLNPMKNKNKKVNEIYIEQLEIKLGIINENKKLNLKFKHEVRNDIIEDEIKEEDYTKHTQVLDDVIVDQLEIYISKMKNHTSDDLKNLINNLEKLLLLINNINAVTTVGTMVFTDMISKFGLNENICNYQNNIEFLNTFAKDKNDEEVIEKYKKFIADLRP